MNGEVVTITRHGKPVAALVSVDVAEAVRKSTQSKPTGLVSYLKSFPSDSLFERNTIPALFLDWLEHMDRENRVFLSVVTIHEMEKGIALLDSKGATAKAADLNRPIAHEGRNAQ